MKKRKRLVVLLILLLCVVIAILAYLLWRNSAEKPEPADGSGVVMEPIGGEIRNDLPGVVIPGWGAMVLPAGKTEAETSLYNPEKNEGYYDLSFTLTLDETGEELFATGKVAPGYQCSKVTLNRALEAGEYAATLLVQPYLQSDPDAQLNRANVSLKLIVK